ncbi:hypothetical protein Yalta_135 [Yalta virus]|nr:hypothetical protein Yalta_135 [Yalta virus]
MSSEQEIILYQKFYEVVEDIFKEKNLLNKLSPLNIEKDKLFIGIVFRSISSSDDDPDFMNWNDDEWIDSMEYPEIYFLSFLFKKQLTIRKIYNIAPSTELKHKLLNKYKNLVRMVKFLESLEKAKKLFIDTSVDLEEIKNKQLQIALNIRNYKDPKNLANIIDLMYHKQFRDNILENIVKGVDKIDVSMLKGFLENDQTSLSSLIENYCTQDNIRKLLIFLMKIDIKGDVFVNEQIYNNVKNYMHGVIKNSDQVQKLLNDIEQLVMNAPVSYKNKINVIVLDTTKDIIKECSNSTNKVVFNKDLIASFDSFSNGEYVKFKSIDLIRRIRDFIFICIQKIIEISALPKEEKVTIFNKYIREYFIDQIENDDDFIMVDKKKLEKNTTSDPNVDKSMTQKMKEMLRDLVKCISEDDDLRELVAIKDMFVETLKYLIQIDFSNINKDDFNIVYNLTKKISSKPNQLRFLFIKLLNTDGFKNILNKFEEDSSLKLNTKIKKQIGDKTLIILKDIIDSLVDVTVLKDLEKYIFFIAKVIDYVLYYVLKIKSVNLKPLIVKQRVVVG